MKTRIVEVLLDRSGKDRAVVRVLRSIERTKEPMRSRLFDRFIRVFLLGGHIMGPITSSTVGTRICLLREEPGPLLLKWLAATKTGDLHKLAR